jgi:hypothetical protein
VLLIDDGAVQQKLDLTREQMQAGSLVYWPKTQDVSFHLRVFGSSSKTDELVRAVGFPTEVTHPTVALSGATASTGRAMFPASPDPAIAAQEPVPIPQISDRAAPAKQLTKIASQPRPMPVMLLPEPPQIGAVADPLAGYPLPLTNTPAPLPRTETARATGVSTPFVNVAVQPVAESGSGRRAVKIPFIGKRKPADFVPPKPLRGPTPQVPALLLAGLSTPIPIDVKLYIDPTGKVDYAELLSEGTGRNRDLASVAVFSSRRWEFVPARLGDRNVPAEVILHFWFDSERH